MRWGRCVRHAWTAEWSQSTFCFLPAEAPIIPLSWCRTGRADLGLICGTGECNVDVLACTRLSPKRPFPQRSAHPLIPRARTRFTHIESECGAGARIKAGQVLMLKGLPYSHSALIRICEFLVKEIFKSTFRSFSPKMLETAPKACG